MDKNKKKVNKKDIKKDSIFKKVFSDEKIEDIKVDIKNRKFIYIITLIISFLFVFVIYIQFKTVEKTDIQTLEAMREVELRSEIASTKRKIEEKEKKIISINEKINEYLNELKNNTSAPELLNKELEQAETYLGYTNITGSGIIITLTDSENTNISSNDILMLINQLKIAGAEAVSINNERLINSSEVVTVNNDLIYVNGKKQNNPYIIKAIGNSKELETAVTTKGGTINELKASGKNVSHRLSNEVEIPKYDRNIDFKYTR